MHKTDVVDYFGTQSATARAFGITRSAVAQWPAVVPERIAWKAQVITKGKLRVDPQIYADLKSRRGGAAS